MSIPSTDFLAEVMQGRYYVDTSELVECVDLPLSPYTGDKLTPEGQYRPLQIIVFVDTASPDVPLVRTVIDYEDKFLPGYLLDITDLLTPYVTDPLVAVEIAVGFSVVIKVNETFYEIPTKASIVKQVGSITNVDFVDMPAITDPTPLSFVTQNTDPVTTFATITGIYILDIDSSSGVFRLARKIDPTFTPPTP